MPCFPLVHLGSLQPFNRLVVPAFPVGEGAPGDQLGRPYPCQPPHRVDQPCSGGVGAICVRHRSGRRSLPMVALDEAKCRHELPLVGARVLGHPGRLSRA